MEKNRQAPKLNTFNILNCAERMKFYVILIWLHLLAAAYIECNSNVASNAIKGSSNVSRTKRAFIKGNQNWETDNKYKYNVMITWKTDSPTMKIKSRDEIGKINNHWLYFKCSGAIIAPTWVLTAASCFQPKIREVQAGLATYSLDNYQVKSMVQTRSVKNLRLHSSYLGGGGRLRINDIDIAMLELDKPFSTDKTKFGYVTVARLAKNIDYSPYKDRNNMRDCIITSYGENDLNARPPFTQKLTMLDVRAAGPKYCEILWRQVEEPWQDYSNPMKDYNENDMFDRFYICTRANKWYDGGAREPENERDLGCFGAVGGALTCDDPNVLVGIQSRRISERYCEDPPNWTYMTFTSVGEDRVYNWIKSCISSIESRVGFWDTQYAYVIRSAGGPTSDNDTASADDTSSTAMVSTCVGLFLSLALSIIAFTF